MLASILSLESFSFSFSPNLNPNEATKEKD
jgi:hypothetical protein